MAASNFERALTLVLENEGGFSNDPRDPGGATNLGITRATLARTRGAAATLEDVRALTRADAAAIYRKRYWNAVRGDDLPSGLDLAVFDLAVNSGPARAARLLQRVLGCLQDGVVGDETLAAAGRSDPAATVRALTRARLDFLRGLPTWPAFGRGWSRRVATVERSALALAGQGRPSDTPATPRDGSGRSAAAASWLRAFLRGLLARRGAARPTPLMKETVMAQQIPTLLFDVLASALARAGADPSLALGPERARRVAESVRGAVQADPRAGRIQEVPDPKPWWRSTTIWGVAISAGLKGLALVFPGQVDPAWAEPLQQAALLAVSFVGDAVAILGRLKAKQPIG